MHTPLPPLVTLQRLFHYNPLTGSLTYAIDRGPRKAGDPAGTTHSGVPRVMIDGQFYPCIDICFALYHQSDPCPLWAAPVDNDPQNLRADNLCLQDSKPKQSRGVRPGIRRGSALSRNRYIKQCKKGWQSSFRMDGRLWRLGVFETKDEAKLARDLASSQYTPGAAKAYALEEIRKLRLKERGTPETLALWL